MPTITVIKKDASFNIPITAGLVGRLQQVLISLLADRTQEERENLNKIISNTKTITELPEEWMEHVITLNHLIRVIELEAIKQGHTYEKDVNEEDSSLLLQSPRQPE
jgi:hypothetical protein